MFDISATLQYISQFDETGSTANKLLKMLRDFENLFIALCTWLNLHDFFVTIKFLVQPLNYLGDKHKLFTGGSCVTAGFVTVHVDMWVYFNSSPLDKMAAISQTIISDEF